MVGSDGVRLTNGLYTALVAGRVSVLLTRQLGILKPGNSGVVELLKSKSMLFALLTITIWCANTFKERTDRFASSLDMGDVLEPLKG